MYSTDTTARGGFPSNPHFQINAPATILKVDEEKIREGLNFSIADFLHESTKKEKENEVLAKLNPILQEYDRRWKNKKHEEVTVAQRGIEGEDAAVAVVKESLDSFNMLLDAQNYPEVVTLNWEHLYSDETRAKLNQENLRACRFLTAHENFMKETRLMLGSTKDEEHAWEILRLRGICNEAFIYEDNMYDPMYKAPFLFGKRVKASDDPMNYDPKGGR